MIAEKPIEEVQQPIESLPPSIPASADTPIQSIEDETPATSTPATSTPAAQEDKEKPKSEGSEMDVEKETGNADNSQIPASMLEPREVPTYDSDEEDRFEDADIDNQILQDVQRVEDQPQVDPESVSKMADSIEEMTNAFAIQKVPFPDEDRQQVWEQIAKQVVENADGRIQGNNLDPSLRVWFQLDECYTFLKLQHPQWLLDLNVRPPRKTIWLGWSKISGSSSLFRSLVNRMPCITFGEAKVEELRPGSHHVAIVSIPIPPCTSCT